MRRLFVFAYDAIDSNEAGIKNNKRYFLPRRKIENYNVLIDGRNSSDYPINDFIKQHDEVRKVLTGQGDGYTTGCLLDYAFFKNEFRLMGVYLSKQEPLDADPRAIQQIVFQRKTRQKIGLYTILEE